MVKGSHNPAGPASDDMSAWLKRISTNRCCALSHASVDDGKSTLISRMLYDSKMIFEDQIAQLEQDSKRVVRAARRLILPCSLMALLPRETGHHY